MPPVKRECGGWESVSLAVDEAVEITAVGLRFRLVAIFRQDIGDRALAVQRARQDGDADETTVARGVRLGEDRNRPGLEPGFA